jgi:hypothetical protein
LAVLGVLALGDGFVEEVGGIESCGSNGSCNHRGLRRRGERAVKVRTARRLGSYRRMLDGLTVASSLSRRKNMKLLQSSILTLTAAAICACGRGAEPEPAMQPASGIYRGDRGRVANAALAESALLAPDLARSSAKSAPTPEGLSRPEQSSQPLPAAFPLASDPGSARLTLAPAFIRRIDVETLTVDGVVATITSARCKREARCGKVGAGRVHADVNACQRELATDTFEALDPECRVGVHVLAVELCANKLRARECSLAVDTIGRLDQCRASSLCLAR